MLNKEWPADDYAIGSYIQSEVASQYLKRLDIKAHHNVLDVGCGNGGFSLKILKQFPMNSYIGLDASENMIALATKTAKSFSHAQFIVGDAMEMEYTNQFDYILSFWCLQWTSDVIIALKNIHQALKLGGKLHAVFPTGDDPFLETYQAILSSGEFPILENFNPPGNTGQFANFESKVKLLPFQSCKVTRDKQFLTLPSYEVFRKFVRGVSFFHGQIKPDIIETLQEAMVDAYSKICRNRYKGKPCFEFTNIYLNATK